MKESVKRFCKIRPEMNLIRGSFFIHDSKWFWVILPDKNLNKDTFTLIGRENFQLIVFKDDKEKENSYRIHLYKDNERAFYIINKEDLDLETALCKAETILVEEEQALYADITSSWHESARHRKASEAQLFRIHKVLPKSEELFINASSAFLLISCTAACEKRLRLWEKIDEPKSACEQIMSCFKDKEFTHELALKLKTQIYLAVRWGKTFKKRQSYELEKA